LCCFVDAHIDNFVSFGASNANLLFSSLLQRFLLMMTLFCFECC